VLAVHGDYDPLRQAQECFDANRPQDAMEVLRLIPQQFYAHPAANAAVSADMLVYALAIDATADPGGRLSRFFEAQTIFYAVIQHLPRFADAYRAFAEFWHRLGNDDMARRILRSVGHVVSDDKLEAQMRRYEPPRTVHIDFPLPPPWQPASRPPRILLITHKRPNYGLDVLCNALQTLIGPENIVDWPWKPTLHGEVAEEQRRYPCMFNYPGVKLSVRDLAEQLLAGRFDAIVFGDMEGHFDPRVLHVIMKAGTACPLIVLDQSDECVDYRHVMAAYLGREPVAIFKREMLTCYDYGPHVYPLPFAYSDDRIPGTVRVEGRSRPLFWAGHRQFSLRRLYIEHIETLLGLDLNQTFSQEEYVHALGDSRIGLNIYGFGYDTVRYWELPAHGCMLLAERLPIAVPHNFVDGTSAVFYDDLGELEQKLLYYIERPEETQAIAQAGHEHLKKYHSGTARAKQFLAWLQPYLPTST